MLQLTSEINRLIRRIAKEKKRDDLIGFRNGITCVTHMLQYRQVQDMIRLVHLRAANCNVKL